MGEIRMQPISNKKYDLENLIFLGLSEGNIFVGRGETGGVAIDLDADYVSCDLDRLGVLIYRYTRLIGIWAVGKEYSIVIDAAKGQKFMFQIVQTGSGKYSARITNTGVGNISANLECYSFAPKK